MIIPNKPLIHRQNGLWRLARAGWNQRLNDDAWHWCRQMNGRRVYQ